MRTISAFAALSLLDLDHESAFPAPWTIVDEETAITVFSMSFDVSQWFVAPGGGWLDPNDDADRSAIEAAISGSIEAIEED